MTILPKKKSSKEKSESEPTDHTHSLTHGHSSTTEGRNRRSSPNRWLPQGASRNDRLVAHDPGGRYEEYSHHNHDVPSTSHAHKRRHRSSPHRSVRKHRHERASVTNTSNVGHNSPTHGLGRASNSPSPSQCEVSYEGYNSGDEYCKPHSMEADMSDEELEQCFERALKDQRDLCIKSMGKDGACLFRAVADQVYGDQEMHSIVRQNCVDYMSKNADFFRAYVTEDFDEYLRRKRLDHCHGNHLELQAMSELYNRPIEVFQYTTAPMNVFHGHYKTDNEPIRVSYHQSTHYNSVVNPFKATIGVGLGLPGHQPGLADKNLMKDAVQQSEQCHIEATMLQDKMRETDWEVTQETIEEQVARESYLQWLKDNEKRAKRQGSPRSASATCSSAAESQSWWDSTLSPEPRTSRSPRGRSNPNSLQNSPNRTEEMEQGPKSPVDKTHFRSAGLSQLSPVQPSTSEGATRSATPEGASAFPETSSIMNQLPPHMLGLSEWDEDDIIAQVMAQSQQEYLDSLKLNAAPSPYPGAAHQRAGSPQASTSNASVGLSAWDPPAMDS